MKKVLLSERILRSGWERETIWLVTKRVGSRTVIEKMTEIQRPTARFIDAMTRAFDITQKDALESFWATFQDRKDEDIGKFQEEIMSRWPELRAEYEKD